MYFQKGAIEELIYPLEEVPTRSEGLVNPQVGDNAYRVPAPLFQGDDGFEEAVYEVVKVRQDVLVNRWPNWFFEDHGVDPMLPEPLKLHGGIVNATTAAYAVHMDSPVDLLLVLIKWLNSNGAEFAHYRYGKASGHRDFLGNPVGIIADGATKIHKALEEAFKVKYFFGLERPEECTHIGPSFTQYPEGSPSHPSFVAGHGAAAGATYGVLVDAFNLTKEQDNVVRTATQHFAMYRTFAGVHYQQDNREGWRLGVAVAQGLNSVCDVKF